MSFIKHCNVLHSVYKHSIKAQTAEEGRGNFASIYKLDCDENDESDCSSSDESPLLDLRR